MSEHFIIENNILTKYLADSETAVVIPDDVVRLADGVFKDCISITTVIIPESVKRIGYYAFENCPALTTVVILAEKLRIEKNTFANSSPIVYCSKYLGSKLTALCDLTCLTLSEYDPKCSSEPDLSKAIKTYDEFRFRQPFVEIFYNNNILLVPVIEHEDGTHSFAARPHRRLDSIPFLELFDENRYILELDLPEDITVTYDGKELPVSIQEESFDTMWDFLTTIVDYFNSP